MANPEHLAKLMEGVEAWGQWRKQNPGVEPFLTLANLHKADLQVSFRDETARIYEWQIVIEAR
jgi:hypothetical protein